MANVLHRPVMVKEVSEALRLNEPNGLIVDATIGSGGHASALLEASHPSTLLIGFDRDEEAVRRSQDVLKVFKGRVFVRHGSVCDLAQVLDELHRAAADRILFDLGISTDQLADPTRGLSFGNTGLLDMRLDRREKVRTADELIHTENERNLQELFSRFGEFRFSKGLARAIVERRREKRFESAAEFAEFVRQYSIARGWRKYSLHPATQVFQALRMAVNRELEMLRACLVCALERISPHGGRCAVISFHSLEDREVKHTFRRAEKEGCVCGGELNSPCQCEHRKVFRVLTRRPIEPSPDEIHANPAARSSKLRLIVCEGGSNE